MTYMFSKGGAETTKLMNVVNLPMQNSTVVRKMTQPAASRPRLNSEDGKGTKASDVPLLVRHALSSVDGLNIRLKDKEDFGPVGNRRDEIFIYPPSLATVLHSL